MSQIEIRPVTADDHAAWLPLWQAYLRFYNTELPEAVTQSTWQRMLDPGEPTHSALAWAGGAGLLAAKGWQLIAVALPFSLAGIWIGQRLYLQLDEAPVGAVGALHQ